MLDTTSPAVLESAQQHAPSVLERFREHRRLRRVDLLGARLARLDAVATLLQGTHVRIAAGWTQEAWFVTHDEQGERHHVGVLRATDGIVSDRACLVAAVAVEALPGTIAGPVAQRAIGTLWNVLHGGNPSATDWNAAPGLNAARARDLIHWNDARDRRASDVLALVDASLAATTRTASLLRTELASA